MIGKLKIAAAAAALSLSPAAFATASAENLKVVASFSILGDFAREVGGDRVTVSTLVGPNGDAHVYEPKPMDAAAVANADVVLVNGLQYEGFLQRLFEVSGTGASVVEASNGAALLPFDHDEDHSVEEPHAHEAAEAGHAHDEHHDEHGAIDPHAWQSVPNAKVYVRNIADAFCVADAEGCDTYRANAEAYGKQLEALDAEIRAAIATVPEEKRTIITSHDAFGYFAHEYGLKFLAPEGASTESEASAADVAALIRQIREDKAAAIFVENITNPRLVEQISSETGITVGGELYSDALSDTGGPAPTYIDMMRHNVGTIKGAILGS
jgi:ABC-type metal ion transport system, periplasmic component/surface adhesin